MITYGIDNGKNGGIVSVDANGEIMSACVMPVRNDGELDLTALEAIFNLCQCDYKPCVYIEQAQAMHKQGVSSTFKIGDWYGMIKGIVFASYIPYEIVNPRKWQNTLLKHAEGKDTKEKSFNMASKLWPEQNWIVPRHGVKKTTKFHDGLTDAALIAEYGRLDRLRKKL